MLPRPRPRPDPDAVRERLRALAAGGAAPPDAPDAAAPAALHAPRVALPAAARPVVVAVGATALAAWLLLRTVTGGAPTPVALVPGTPLAVASGSLAAVPAASASHSRMPDLVVHVVGEVRAPGLVRLAPGSRVADAIEAAGGLRKGGSSGELNLARVLVDGEQVDVTRTAAAAPPAASGSGGVPAGPVNLNTATLDQLDSLPGVGPVMAGRIVDWRTQHGRFASVDQLREISGIGDRTFDRLSPLVTV